jgi:hypothetical protein
MLPYADVIYASWDTAAAGKRRRTGKENRDPHCAACHDAANTATADTPIPTTPCQPFVRSDGQLLLRTSINASQIYWPNGHTGFAQHQPTATPTDRTEPQPPSSGGQYAPFWDAGRAPRCGDPGALKKIGVAEELRLHFEVRLL